MKCPKCSYEGKGRYRFLHWFVIVGLLFAGGNLYLQLVQVNSNTKPEDMLITGIMLSLAVLIGLVIYGAKEFCPKCGNKHIVIK